MARAKKPTPLKKKAAAKPAARQVLKKAPAKKSTPRKPAPKSSARQVLKKVPAKRPVAKKATEYPYRVTRRAAVPPPKKKPAAKPIARQVLKKAPARKSLAKKVVKKVAPARASRRAAVPPPRKKPAAKPIARQVLKKAPARKSPPKKVVKKVAPARASRRAAVPPPNKKPASKPIARQVVKKTPARKSSPKKVAPARAPRRAAGSDWVHLATPKKHGLSKDFEKRPRSTAGIVYVSPTTNKVIESPRKNQKVLYAHRDAKGELHVLHPLPQKPDVRLKAWLKNSMGKSSPVLFVQQALQVVRPPKSYKPKKMEKIVRGVLVRRKPRESEYRPVHETKLARPTTSKKQQAILYRAGKTRPVEGGRAYHTRSELTAYSRAKPVVPGKILNIPMTGETIWDTIKPILVDKSLKRLKPYEEIYYEYIVVYRDPVTGEKMTIPGRGRAEPDVSVYQVRKQEPGGFPKGAMVAMKRLHRAAWPIATQIARSIRLSLAESGVRFSSMYTLEKLKKNLEKRLDKEGDSRAAANINQALIHTEYLRPTTHAGRVLHGEEFSKIRPLRAERADGRMHRDVKDALRVMLRITIVENKERKREFVAKQKPKRKR